MPRCGVCGELYGELITKHAYTCEDDSKAGATPYAPEINDLIRQQEEDKTND